jgi:hypothetical protein
VARNPGEHVHSTEHGRNAKLKRKLAEKDRFREHPAGSQRKQAPEKPGPEEREEKTIRMGVA